MLSSLTPSLLLVAAAAAQGAPKPPADLAITNARIEVGNGTVISNGTIVIHNGRIAAVGENASVPSGVAVFDAKGSTVYPGFIDAYTTSGLKLPDAPSYGTAPSNRETAPPTMWHGNRKGIRGDISAAKALDIKSRLTDNYAQGITTALISSGAGSVRGVSTLVDYLGTGNPVIADAACEFSFRGGGGGGGGGGYPGTLFGVTATLRQTLADTQYYASQTNPTKDATYENLKPVVNGSIPAIFSVDSAREIVRATRIAGEFNMKLIVAGAHEAYRDIDVLKAKNVAVIAAIDPGFEPSTKAETTPGSTPQEVLNERHDAWQEHQANVKKLAEAGVPFAFSSASSSLSDFLKNVRALITGGLPRDAALKGLTSGAADILGASREIGTVEAGKRANLVLMSGDFADAKSEVLSVVVDGEKVEVKKGGAK